MEWLFSYILYFWINKNFFSQNSISSSIVAARSKLNPLLDIIPPAFVNNETFYLSTKYFLGNSKTPDVISDVIDVLNKMCDYPLAKLYLYPLLKSIQSVINNYGDNRDLQTKAQTLLNNLKNGEQILIPWFFNFKDLNN
jgi:hypothetical protein